EAIAGYERRARGQNPGRQGQPEIGDCAGQPAKSKHPAVLRCGRVCRIMGNRTVIMIEPQDNTIGSKVGRSAWIFACVLATLFFAFVIPATEAAAQMRRPGRVQKKIEKNIEKLAQPRGTSKVSPSGSSSGSSSNNPASNLTEDTALDEQPETAV